VDEEVEVKGQVATNDDGQKWITIRSFEVIDYDNDDDDDEEYDVKDEFDQESDIRYND
jgi:hypothetical protein